MNTNTISKWAGYGASFFNIVCFGEGMAYAITEGDLPTWFAFLTGTCFLLAALSSVVCLGAALIGHFRHRRKSSPPAAGQVSESPA